MASVVGFERTALIASNTISPSASPLAPVIAGDAAASMPLTSAPRPPSSSILPCGIRPCPHLPFCRVPSSFALVRASPSKKATDLDVVERRRRTPATALALDVNLETMFLSVLPIRTFQVTSWRTTTSSILSRRRRFQGPDLAKRARRSSQACAAPPAVPFPGTWSKPSLKISSHFSLAIGEKPGFRRLAFAGFPLIVSRCRGTVAPPRGTYSLL